MGLSDTAFLVGLNIRMWSARKYDRKLSNEIAADKEIDSNRGRYNKVLIAKSAIKAVEFTASAARAFHIDNTLPWENGAGRRILPATNFEVYRPNIQQHIECFEDKAKLFCDNYLSMVEQARIDLKSLFRPSDYPSGGQIYNKFSISLALDPFPNENDFRCSLADHEIEALKAESRTREQATEKRLTDDLWGRVYTALSHFVERLSHKDNVFRDSLLGNIANLVDLLPRLNVLNDPGLDDKRRELEDLISGITADDLRKDPFFRAETRFQASKILEGVALVDGQPGLVGVQSEKITEKEISLLEADAAARAILGEGVING